MNEKSKESQKTQQKLHKEFMKVQRQMLKAKIKYTKVSKKRLELYNKLIGKYGIYDDWWNL